MNESNTTGVFGEEIILWVCILRQSPRRPPPDHLFRQVNHLLDELKSSPAAQLLPVVSVDDGLFAIAALVDEIAMALPDIRPYWAQTQLQAHRWTTNNAGVEFYQRLQRVRGGPRSVVATYMVVLGCGFLGQYGLPGRDHYQLIHLRSQLAREQGVDTDRDVTVGSVKPYRYNALPAEFIPRDPWHKSVWMGRALALLLLAAAGALLGFTLDGR